MRKEVSRQKGRGSAIGDIAKKSGEKKGCLTVPGGKSKI